MLRFHLRIVTIALLVALSGVLSGQSPDGPTFEVASVRANTSNSPATSRFPLGPGDAYTPGNFFIAINQPLIAYVRFAYKLGQSDLTNLAPWVNDDRLDIEARAAGNPTKDQMRLMMRPVSARFPAVRRREYG